MSAKLNARLSAARTATARWWQQRPPRERWMLLGGGIAAVIVAIDLSWTGPLEKQARRLEAELRARQEALAKSSEPVPPGQAQEARRLREQEAALRQRLQAAQAARARLGQETAQLPDLLRTLTGQMGSLRLMALELSPDPASTSAANADPSRQNAALALAGALSGMTPPAAAASGATAQPPLLSADGQTLHRLPLMLRVSGPYADLQRLLGHIEAQAPSLQWTSLTLDNSTWPAVQLTLRAQAVSVRPNWGRPS